MTKAEACLWKYVLRARKLSGYQFRRQRPVLNYIADFMSTDLMLIIEVDGGSHHSEKARRLDNLRQKELEDVGFTVLRFKNYEVLTDIKNVEKKLMEFVQDFEKQDEQNLEIEESTP